MIVYYHHRRQCLTQIVRSWFGSFFLSKLQPYRQAVSRNHRMRIGNTFPFIHHLEKVARNKNGDVSGGGGWCQIYVKLFQFYTGWDTSVNEILISKAPFTRVRTNFCTDEFCSWTACLHGSVQILLQIPVVFTRLRANFKTSRFRFVLVLLLSNEAKT